MLKKRKNSVYLTQTPAERKLFIRGMISFRNKVIAREIDTVDIDRILEKVIQ